MSETSTKLSAKDQRKFREEAEKIRKNAETKGLGANIEEIVPTLDNQGNLTGVAKVKKSGEVVINSIKPEK